MSEGAGRQERKQQTRQAILDAALAIADEESLATASLRRITKSVGIVPTAFYRHFESVDELGLALVDQSFASLRAMLRDVRRTATAVGDIIAGSVDVLVEHVHQRRQHFRFVARERTSGPPVVRSAIRHELELFERELATDLARLPGSEDWSGDDLRIMANLIVTAMVSTAESIVAVPAGRPDVEREIVRTATVQLRMIVVGAREWRSR